MKNVIARIQATPAQVLDIRQPDHAARLSEAFARERLTVQAALAELAAMRFGDAAAREDTALATMAPLPDHALMARAPREVLRLRAALFLVSCHDHRKN